MSDYETVDGITPLEGTIHSLQSHYTYNDITVQFNSHHGRFMLEKAVCLQRALLDESTVEETLSKNVHPTMLKALERVSSQLNIAMSQWWYPEAEHLVRYYMHEVCDFSHVVEKIHKGCGKGRTCSHKNWYSTGSPVQRNRFAV